MSFNRIMIDTALRGLPIDTNNPVIAQSIKALEEDMSVVSFINSEEEIKAYLLGFSRGSAYASQLALDGLRKDIENFKP